MRGSVLRRGKTWCCYWSSRDPATGERVQHSKGGHRTRAEAQGFLAARLAEVAAGTFKTDEKLAVHQLLLDRWLPARESEGLRPSTVALYSAVATSWVVPHIGGTPLSALTPRVMAELVEKLRANGSTQGRGELSPRSVQLAVTVTKSATRWAVTTGLLRLDPLAGYKRPRAEAAPVEAWSPDELRTFLDGAREDRDGWAWALLATRGMRRGEVCGLRWSDVDLEGGVLRITRARVIVDGKPAESLPKTGRGKRNIPLDPHLVGMLRALRARQSQEKLLAAGAYSDQAYLLADELGTPLYPDTLSERFDDLVKALELRRIHLHGLRHSCASALLANGVPVRTVADLLGHDPAVCLRTYAHVIPAQAAEATAALSARLLG